jgi:ribonuclease J
MANKVTLTVMDGSDTIGGTKILVEDNSTRFFIDFGLNFKTHKLYFSEYLQPRTASKLTDYFELGLLPQFEVDSIYRQDFLYHLGFEAKAEPSIDGVLLSHAHMDHAGMLEYLRDDIPLICSQVSKMILDTRFTLKSNETITLKKRFYYKASKSSSKYSRVIGETLARPVKTESQVQMGNITLQNHAVDHSLPGAMGTVIETGVGNIVYTGDLRKHGYREKETEAFIEAASNSEPELLIIEGTNAGGRETISEGEVFQEIVKTMKKTDKLVVANYPYWDFDRLLSFYRATKENGRILLLSIAQAYLLKQLEGIETEYPPLSDKNIGIYIPKRGWGLMGDLANIPEYDWVYLKEEPYFSKKLDGATLIAGDYSTQERDYIYLDNSYSWKDVQKKQDEFVVFCNFFGLKDLLDLKPEKGSKYIWSVTAPIDEESAIDFERAQNWLEHFNLPMVKAHSSGHAIFEEIIDFIEQINPKAVLPVHTDNRKRFKKEVKKTKVIFDDKIELS